jgi:flagellar biosynthesis protein FlhF
MQFFFFFVRNRRECLGKIVEECGERVVITRQRAVSTGGFLGFFTREGVELEFYIPPVLTGSSARQAYPNLPAYNVPGDTALSVPSGGSGSLEEEKRKLLMAAGRDPSMMSLSGEASQNKILEELREIKQKIDSPAQKEDHPGLSRMEKLLKLNDFSDAYTAQMLDKARSELPMETLDDFSAAQDRLLEWIGETIRIYNEPFVSQRPAARTEGRIVALVGPTGVGKTTTIAKLAAVFGIDKSGASLMPVRIITIDAFRIGARAQIEKFGEIMGIPVSYIDNRRDLRKEIALYQEETDLILIDTIGKSPKDYAKLGEMKEFLDVCGSRMETHLVLSASTKTSDIAGILQQYEPFNYRSVIISKLDETSHVGNIISSLADRGKAVSYITDGQTVPVDIKKADVVRFLINLDEFTVNREKIEKRFPAEEARILW